MKTTAGRLVDEPLPQPRRWGEPELARLSAMVGQASLFYWGGPQTQGLLEEFRRHYPLPECFPTSSGSAAIHVAVAALRLQPGDEVIVPAITDMGSVLGILYQQGVPVFADVEPRSYNLDAADVRGRLSARTRAIMPVHLAGNPCDLGPLLALAREHRLEVIEDCAQAWGAKWQGQPVGLAGHLACYSFNDYKHLSCGDGGLVATADPRWRGVLSKWGDKYYDRVTGERNPSELAPNYRMSEPQAAVAVAQLTRLPAIVSERIRVGERMMAGLAGVEGLLLPEVRSGDTHSYWFLLVRLESARFTADRDTITRALSAEGVPAEAGYIPRAVYRYDVFQEHNFFGGRWPVRDFGLTNMDYRQVNCPVAEAVLADSIRFTINEAMSDAYVDQVTHAVRTVLRRFTR
jgi:perosamine synthetase